jgi:hypothetical protein
MLEQRALFERRLWRVERDLNDAELQLEGVDQEVMDDACLALAAEGELAQRRRERRLPEAEQRLPEHQRRPQAQGPGEAGGLDYG